MAYPVITLVPDQASYSVDSPVEVLRVKLDGGAPRSRKDILGAWHTVTVQWSCTKEEYDYLWQAYRYCTQGGGIYFEIDLYLYKATVKTRHVASFVPGTFALKSNNGGLFIVGAQLDVEPIDATTPVAFPVVGTGAYYGFLDDVVGITATEVQLMENKEGVAYPGTYICQHDGGIDRYMALAFPTVWGTPTNFIIQGFNYTLDTQSVTINGVPYTVYYNDASTGVTSITVQVS